MPEDSTFADLIADQRILKAVRELGFETPTPIQIAAIPLISNFKDVVGQAKTGTGKTAAFGIPILERVAKDGEPGVITALILTPTRELALQIHEEFERLGKYTDVRSMAVYGGQPIEKQVQKLAEVRIVSGTPGRVMDLIRRENLTLRHIRIMVLDEADRMLDMGFIEDVEWILKRTPSHRQTLLFSATMPQAILDLSRRYLRKPENLLISRDKMTVEAIAQEYYRVGRKNKVWALTNLFDTRSPERTLVFCSTKRTVEWLKNTLSDLGYSVGTLHGDLSQAKRERELADFKAGTIKVLVASDVAARGLDIEDTDMVVNYDVPEDPRDYLHRIGRTGRAGAAGVAVTFITSKETHLIKDIEKVLKTKVDLKDVPEPENTERVKRQIDLEELSDHFGMVKFRISQGEENGFTMTDAMSLFTYLRIPERLVGQVEIGKTESTVEIHREVAMKVFRKARWRDRKGGKIRVEISESVLQ